MENELKRVGSKYGILNQYVNGLYICIIFSLRTGNKQIKYSYLLRKIFWDLSRWNSIKLYFYSNFRNFDV